MPKPRVTMSKIRHTLQLLHSANLSQRKIGAALGISKSTVSEIASYARAAAVDWAQAQLLSDEELQARLYRPAVARQSRHLEPDYAHLHSELKRSGVTLQLLWEEYQQQHQGEAYKYSAFCEKYQQWAKRLKRSMQTTPGSTALCGLRQPDRSRGGCHTGRSRGRGLWPCWAHQLHLRAHRPEGHRLGGSIIGALGSSAACPALVLTAAPS